MRPALHRRRPTPRTRTLALAVGSLGALVGVGCIERPVAVVGPRTESGITISISNQSLDKVDLLVMVDNSNSMAENQEHIGEQLGPMIETLTNPPCTNATNTTPHTCDPSDPDDHQVYPPVKSLHVAVVDSDLGTPGSSLCSDHGDDGLFNPIHYGESLQHHLPWQPPPASCGTNVPPPPTDGSLRPMDCTDPAAFPQWIEFTSEGATAESRALFTHDFRCNAGLYVCGCGLEQQIESVWRSLVWHGANGAIVSGGDALNAGDGTAFLRDDALLAIVMLTDEEDGSVQDCAYAMPGEACVDKTGVYQNDWSTETNPNNKFYLYQPGSAQDPTWPIDRYYDTQDNTRGLLGLKPHHPERVLFAAITGVPLEVPHHTVGSASRVDWDALLGAPGPNGPNDFYGRDLSTAVSGTQDGAPFTMQTGPVAGCTGQLTAACYRPTAGQVYDPSQPCSTSIYRAFPSRRVVELARRFDEAPSCADHQPCHNGLVESICAQSYGGAMQNIVNAIQSRIGVPCLQRPLATRADYTTGLITVDCKVVETEPDDTTDCSAIPGHHASLDARGQPAFSVDRNGVRHALCEIDQVPTYPDGSSAGPAESPVTGGVGWYYDRVPQNMCSQRIVFTPTASPGSGTVTQLECIQSVSGPDAGAGGG